MAGQREADGELGEREEMTRGEEREEGFPKMETLTNKYYYKRKLCK